MKHLIERIESLTEAMLLTKAKVSMPPSVDEMRGLLAKMKVGKGGKGQSVDLGDGWEIDFFENRQKSSRKKSPYVLVLKFNEGPQRGGRSQTAGLGMDKVFTKSNSMWPRDSVWRLKPETVSKMAAEVVKAIKKTFENYKAGDRSMPKGGTYMERLKNSTL